MTTMNVTVTIWWKAILINAALVALGSIFHTGIAFLIVFIIVLACGFIITLPLFPVIHLLVTIHTRISYGTVAKIAWLRFMLLLLVWFMYGVFHLLTKDTLMISETILMLIGIATSIAVTSAIAFTRKSLRQLLDGTQGEPWLN